MKEKVWRKITYSTGEPQEAGRAFVVSWVPAILPKKVKKVHPLTIKQNKTNKNFVDMQASKRQRKPRRETPLLLLDLVAVVTRLTLASRDHREL